MVLDLQVATVQPGRRKRRGGPTHGTAVLSAHYDFNAMASFNTRLYELMMHPCTAASVQLVPLYLNVASTQSRATGKAADGGGGDGGGTA